VHGLLVGVVAVVFMVSDRLLAPGSGARQQEGQQEQHGTSRNQAAPGARPGSTTRAATVPAAATSSVDASSSGTYSEQVEQALRLLLSEQHLHEVLHEPEVVAALADIRHDVSNISKYQGDGAVMEVFQKLLEIESILEDR
jgi:hypothetical protein